MSRNLYGKVYQNLNSIVPVNNILERLRNIFVNIFQRINHFNRTYDNSVMFRIKRS